MFKKIVSVFMALMAFVASYAQMPMGGGDMSLPLNPKVKSGVLPNGLSYYILHNEEPKERANFYIAQKVGSTLETQDQLGLAHFLEHMAFNGTTNFPGKNLLNYLQSKGIRFGADINAYTSMDETVYNINNVPTTDKNLMDSVLLALHDWSGEILLEDAEIDAERGVIQEEWRSGWNAQRRRLDAILPQIYEEYQYQQLPIGKMEVVMNFKPDVLRAYYKKWYRPDLQGIIIVGDFDAAEMEKKVIDLFSTIVMPENAAERIYTEVSDNEEPIYASFSDVEQTRPNTTISFKSDTTPFEERNTIEYYIENSLVENILTGLFDNRLQDFSQEPQCNYVSAGIYFGEYYVSKTKDSFNISVTSKGNTEAAVSEAMGIVARACKTGFNYSEYERVKDELMASIESAYNERDKTDNEALGRELCDHFINNTPDPGIETEYMLWQSLLPNIPLEIINMAASELLTVENMVIVTSEPKAEGFEIVAQDVMLASITNAMNADYEPLEEEKITEPLIASLPNPGTIIEKNTDQNLGITTYLLSNGVRVVIKPTDFSADEILMTAFRKGGKQIYPITEAADVLMMPAAFNSSKVGPFDNKTLDKYLAGKKVGFNYSLKSFTDEFSGSSTIKDLPSLMELIYAYFVELNPDTTTWQVNLDKMKISLANTETNPQYVFSDKIDLARYNNPLMQRVNTAILNAADYEKSYNMVKKTIGNAAEYTFIFVGNIDEESFQPLIEQYIATLPSGDVLPVEAVTPISIRRGQYKDEYKQPMQTPSTMVYDIYSGNDLKFDIKNNIMIELIGDILGNIFTDTLREEEGGSYSPAAGGVFDPALNTWSILYLFSTNAEQQAKMIGRANDELENLLSNGADETNFNKAKEAAVKQLEININKNGYWNNVLTLYLRGYDLISNYEEILNSITLQEFNDFMKNLYDGKNRIQVIMEGVESE